MQFPLLTQVFRPGFWLYNRRTLTGRVQTLRKQSSLYGNTTVYNVRFNLVVERLGKPDRIIKVGGEVWGEPHVTHAEMLTEGCRVKVVGCLKGNRYLDLELVQVP